MKKLISLAIILVLATSLLAGCGKEETKETQNNNNTQESTSNNESKSSETESKEYEDGTYFAAQADFDEHSGWKSVVILEVKDGKIVDVEWNAVHKDGGVDKVTASKNGDYGMVANGGAQAEWHEQAELAEAYLLEVQDPSAITYDEDGHTDAIAGVSVHVNDLVELANEALAAGPTERGPYKDGAYHAEEDEFSNGWKYTVDLTVLYGKILAANWNGISEENPELDKKTASINGDYGMVANGGAQSEWHEQAALAEAYLLETQDPTAIEYKDDEGHTDAIAGVSIHVIEFFSLAEEALADAK